jgi:hypothetical protein
MVGFHQPLLQLSQDLLNESTGTLFFSLSIISGVVLIYLLFRDVKINKREPVG